MNTIVKCRKCRSPFPDHVIERFGGMCPACMAGFAELGGPLPAAGLQPGEAFGRYRIERLVGQGGMGIVYEARQDGLDRRVALKVMLPRLAADAGFVDRFRREANTLAALDHSNIVKIYDFGVENGVPYLAMEYVEGSSLRHLIAAGTLTSERALRIGPPLCDALAYAHDRGIVHRDIKPENILVGGSGVVKIADFGLAKLIGAEAGAPSLTATGATMGTPHYMAPEQLKNPRAVDPRVDIYAMGVVLYEMLTGDLPVGRFPLPSALLPGGRNVDDVVMKALEKDPAQRYATARGLGDDLKNRIEAAPPSPVRSLRWMVIPAAALILLTLLAFGAIGIARVGSLRQRRAQVERLLAEGHQALELARKHRAFLDQARQVERNLIAEIAPDAGPDQKRPLWEIQREIAERTRQASSCQAACIQKLMSVLALEPDNTGARRDLAAIYYGEFEEAEREGDAQRMQAMGAMVRLHGTGALAARLSKGGQVDVNTHPAGAVFELCRYEEAEDRRLKLVTVQAKNPCPVALRDLAPGSYLILLQKAGYRDTLYPVLVGRDTLHNMTVNIHPEDRIGAGFVHVPAGSFVAGGGEAPGAGQKRIENTGDCFIGRCEVTLAEYLEFLNDLIATAGVENAQRLVIRSSGPGPVHFWRIPADATSTEPPSQLKPAFPVTGISWEDAQAYCEWRTRRARQRGDRATYRLPTGLEWEQAARGVDGRAYPWGNNFDRSFVGSPGMTTMPFLKPVGSHPHDESPYGVLDMAGGVEEWCIDEDARTGTRLVRGGSLKATTPAEFQPAGQSWAAPSAVSFTRGFRIVRVPAE